MPGSSRFRPSAIESCTCPFGLTHAWDGDASAGSYRLRLRGQTTIIPATATVTVRVPDGMAVSRTGAPTNVRGGVAIWHGEMGIRRDFEIAFQKPLLGRIATRVWGFLTIPAFRT